MQQYTAPTRNRVLANHSIGVIVPTDDFVARGDHPGLVCG